MDKKRITASAERIAEAMRRLECGLYDMRLDWNAILEEFAEHKDSPKDGAVRRIDRGRRKARAR